MRKMQGDNEKRFDGIDRRFDRMDERFEKLESCVDGNRDAIREINLRLENEICPSVRCVAEGHLDLSRKLDEALKREPEREMTILRLNFVEGEMGRLKKQIEIRI